MRLLRVVLAIAAGLWMSGCAGSNTTREHVAARDPMRTDATAAEPAAPNTAVLTVHGMGCPQCANNVDSQLMKVPGVESVAIAMGSGRVLARLSPSSPPTRDQLVKAIENTGFTLVKIQMPR